MSFRLNLQRTFLSNSSAAASAGTSILLASRIVNPNGTLIHFPGLGSGADGDGAFWAPSDMTLVAWSDRSSRAYRTDFSAYIRINGGPAVLLKTIPIDSTGHRLHSENISILRGDRVELLYTCGNNFNMGMVFCFYFENADNTSSGPTILQTWGAAQTSANPFRFGDLSTSSYAIDIAVPVDLTLTDLGYAMESPAVDNHTIRLRKNSIGTTITTLNTGSNSLLLNNLEETFVAGDYLNIEVSSPTVSNVAVATLGVSVSGKTPQPNRTWLAYSTTTATAAGSWTGSAPSVMPRAGRIIAITVAAPFGYGINKNIYINRNYSTDESLGLFSMASNSIETREVNYSFGAGDTLLFSHDGTGVTGAGLWLSVTIEFNTV